MNQQNELNDLFNLFV